MESQAGVHCNGSHSWGDLHGALLATASDSLRSLGWEVGGSIIQSVTKAIILRNKEAPCKRMRTFFQEFLFVFVRKDFLRTNTSIMVISGQTFKWDLMILKVKQLLRLMEILIIYSKPLINSGEEIEVQRC